MITVIWNNGQNKQTFETAKAAWDWKDSQVQQWLDAGCRPAQYKIYYQNGPYEVDRLGNTTNP